ncbi:folylpolyglutamate synthase [Coemansia sp. Benny D115]|nr:folylpolyglutamate synthase [Coemansia sp. Benny D115]
MADAESSGRVRLGLERIVRFFERVLPTDPRANLQVVHVTGTNGKGSVCALVAEALDAAGYRAGTFNSPHFLEPRDAARIQGHPMPAAEYAELRRWISELDRKAESSEGPLTLFEQATVAAVWWFAQRKVDVAVIEVGMGGLRDATNVFGTPDGRSSLGVGRSLVQCICPIGMDHVGMIGSTVEEIAHEKSGIVRPGAWVVVAGQERAEAFHRIRQIAHRLSPGRVVNVRRQPMYDLHVPGFSIAHESATALRASPPVPSWASFNGTGRRCLRARYPPTLEGQSPVAATELDLPLMLPGDYQAGNAGVAFYALDVLRTKYGFDRLTDSAIQAGFHNVRWPGRLSWLRLGGDRTPASQRSSTSSSASGSSCCSGGDSLDAWILADGAHNEPAAAELRKYVDTTLRRIGQQRYIHATTRGRSLQDVPRVRWIVGFSRGKDVAALLSRLAHPGDSVWAVPFSQPEEMPWVSCTDAEEIRAAAEAAGLEAACYASLADALERLLAAEQSDDAHLTVLCGSLYLVADLYRELQISPFGEESMTAAD